MEELFSHPKGESSLFGLLTEVQRKHLEINPFIVNCVSAYVVTSGHHPQFPYEPIRWGNNGKVKVKDYFLGFPRSISIGIVDIKLKDVVPWKKNYEKSRQHIKK